MSPALALPLVLPLGLGAFLTAFPAIPLRVQRTLAIVCLLAVLSAALRLFALSFDPGSMASAAIGDWPAPYGIVLIADPLGALMLLLSAVLALSAMIHVIVHGTDTAGRAFHALFQFQVLGLAGAFLTGDLFNLFVFFEVLLIASYGLLMHGGGAHRTRAALHYAVVNLTGSSLFLIAVALIYSGAGTLNMADLASKLGGLENADAALAGAGVLLLGSVFGLKAALVPLHAWLPGAYAAAAAPVAALFAILTKVGIYALVRLWMLLQGLDGAHPSLAALDTILAGGAVLTLLAGGIGAVAATDLRQLISYLILVSIGMLLAGISAGSTAALAGALYYLIQTTLITGGLFLLAEPIAARRREGTRLVASAGSLQAPALAALFALAAVAIAGMPPFSGFIGKALILNAVHRADIQGFGSAAAIQGLWIPVWTATLVSSLLVILALARAGVLLFWRGAAGPRPRHSPACRTCAAAVLIATGPLLALFAGPVTGLSQRTAEQSLDRMIAARLAQAPSTRASGGAAAVTESH